MEYHLADTETASTDSKSRLLERLRDAFNEEERLGYMLALKVRSAFLVMIIVWQIAENSEGDAEAFFNIGQILAFLVIGLVQFGLLRANRHPNWLAYILIAADCVILSFILVAPNPFQLESDWPLAIVLRGTGFVWYFIFLMQAAFSLRPMLVLWCGFSIVVSRTVSVLWVVLSSDASFKLSETPRDLKEALETYFNHDFVNIGEHFQEIFSVTLVAIGLAIVVRRTRRFVESRAQAERSRSHLARYFSPNMVDEISKAGGIDNTPHDQEVAVLFADIIGFTSFCETEPAENVVALLRDYHGLLSDAVFHHGGTLDKYMGDGLMATFGTPHKGPHDATDALRCALYMVESLREWNARRVSAGNAPVHVGIGLHYGVAVVGDIGDERHVEFAVIGDTVNVASRIENLTRKLETPLTVSDDLIKAMQQEGSDGDDLLGKLVEAGPQEISGRKQEMNVWMVA